MDNYNEKMENNVLEIIKQKEQADKRLLNVEIVLMVISIIFLFAIVAVIAFVDIPLLAKIVIGIIGFIQLIIAGLVSFKIKQKAGYYECMCCHHRYIPTYAQSIFSQHIGRKNI